MYTAVANVKVTPAYWEALMQNPDSDRAAAIAQAMASVGGKMHFFAFTNGKWDAIVAGEAPTEAAFMSVIAKAWMAGMLQDVETIPCIAQKTVTEVMLQSTRTVILQTSYPIKALVPSNGFAVCFHPNVPIFVWLKKVRTLVQKIQAKRFKTLINPSN